MNTQTAISTVVSTVERYGQTSIIALSGVPGTGKSHIARRAAKQIASHPTLVREIQFHPSYGYEEFIEGVTLSEGGGVSVRPGLLLEHNAAAFSNPDDVYVILIEELTRANVAAVLGELLTYVEYRNEPFFPLYSRMPTKIAPNLRIIATYNPTDRSAIDLDGALLRRLRILNFPPSIEQLQEMLEARGIPQNLIVQLKTFFEVCRQQHSEDFENGMPFGHGIFSEVNSEEPDLKELWQERIRHFLRRPLLEPHPFTQTIEAAYKWR